MTLIPILDITATTAGLALIILTAPLICELLLLTLASWLPAKSHSNCEASSKAMPRITAVVPAHNEALLIDRCVRSLLDDQLQDASVLVVAHNCTDATAAVARAAGARVIEVRDNGCGGKGSALRAGLAEAVNLGAEALMVVDADSVASPRFLRTAQEALARHDAIQVRYQLACDGAERQARLSCLGFLGVNLVRPRGRERLGLSAGIFGNGFGFRSALLAQVPYTTTSMVEDLEYHLRLVRSGVRVRFLEHAMVTSEVAPRVKSGSDRQQARWEGGRFLATRLWAPGLAWDVLRGRWRSAEPLLDLFSMPLALAVVLLLFALAVPLAWSQMYALLAFSVLVAHVLSAAAEADGLQEGIKTVVSVPLYIGWKLSLVPGTLRASRRNAVWTPTARDQRLAYKGRGEPVAEKHAVSVS